MPYGPDKLSSPEVKKAIADVITGEIMDRIAKCSEFANTSLAFIGVRFTYSVDMEFMARGETSFKVSGKGEHIKEGERADRVERKIKVKARGTHAAGKKRKDEKHHRVTQEPAAEAPEEGLVGGTESPVETDSGPTGSETAAQS